VSPAQSPSSTLRITIRNLRQLATAVGRSGLRGAQMRQLQVIDRPAIVIEEGRFAWIGPESDLPEAMRRGSTEIDGEGGSAIPGFVDSHTHLPFAGSRESEFNRRLSGETYEQIAASGGGIASTVRATRHADATELTSLVLERTGVMARYGTTSCEAKSGYGLSLEHEVKQLQALEAARSQAPVRIVSTALPAHEFPPEYRRDLPEQRRAWIAEISGTILPELAGRQLARYNDVFVERGVFTRDEGREVLLAGSALGLVPRIHADELSDTGGAALAAEVGAASADHLMYVSDDGIRALAASGTVANLLPATSFFLMSDRYAPARELLEQGAIVSLSTDCNPGSSMTESMQMVIQLASLRMKMTVEEALTAATLNGAHSLGIAEQCGSIEVGKSADLVILQAPTYLHLVYHFGVNLVRQVFSAGRQVVSSGRLVGKTG
jgi:imidazolonepropionase